MTTECPIFIQSTTTQMDKLFSEYILVIEDEPLIGGKIVNELANFMDSNQIKLTTSVDDALHLLNTFKFNIIILDLNLSDGNGITILNKVKKNDLNSLVYVFSINSELKRICIKKGATAFFDKSKDFNNLISTVKTNFQEILI